MAAWKNKLYCGDNLMTNRSVLVPGFPVAFLDLLLLRSRFSFLHGLSCGVRLPDGAPRQGESDSLEVNPFFSSPSRTPPQPGLPATGGRGETAHKITRREVNASWERNQDRGSVRCPRSPRILGCQRVEPGETGEDRTAKFAEAKSLQLRVKQDFAGEDRIPDSRHPFLGTSRSSHLITFFIAQV